jgi:hypothetical protein
LVKQQESDRNKEPLAQSYALAKIAMKRQDLALFQLTVPYLKREDFSELKSLIESFRATLASIDD